MTRTACGLSLNLSQPPALLGEKSSESALGGRLCSIPSKRRLSLGDLEDWLSFSHKTNG